MSSLRCAPSAQTAADEGGTRGRVAGAVVNGGGGGGGRFHAVPAARQSGEEAEKAEKADARQLSSNPGALRAVRNKPFI